MNTFLLTDYKVVSTGVGEDQYYISAITNYKGSARAIIVIFKSPSCEELLIEKTEISVIGHLVDEGMEESLMLLETEIV